MTRSMAWENWLPNHQPRRSWLLYWSVCCSGSRWSTQGSAAPRKLAGVFYFRDMTVLRVMFTALITAMLGLSVLSSLSWLDLQTQIYLLPTVYGAQIVGGLIFGVGFALSGWCPGTGMVGVATGKLDALVFLFGVMLGAIVYNETYSVTKPLLESSGVQTAFGMDRNLFALLFTLVAIGAFYAAELAEKKVAGGGAFLHSTTLRLCSVSLLIAGVIVFLLPANNAVDAGPAGSEQALLTEIESAGDHLDPEQLADTLMQGNSGLLVIDLRPADEYEQFHIPSAVNVALPELPEYLAGRQPAGTVVLYSNGMTHPAQARDSLTRLGYQNVYLLTDGLQGFLDRCLKPVSLRSEPLSAAEAAQVNAWRAFFLGEAAPPAQAAEAKEEPEDAPVFTEIEAPRVVSTAWLAEHLQDDDLRVIDCRTHADYTSGHIPGAVYLQFESIRGDVDGLPSVLLPKQLLAEHMSLLGVKPTDMVVFDPGDSVRDATLISMALQRLGHQRWAVLHGGYLKWSAENRPSEQTFPAIAATAYPVPDVPDSVTVDAEYISARLGDGQTVIIDTRPHENFSGEKSNEMRRSHPRCGQSRVPRGS